MINISAVQDRLIELTEELREYVELRKRPRTKLSKSARKRLATLEANLRAILEPEEKSDFIYDTAAVGRFFGVTPRTVQRWVSNRGCPRIKHGVFDLKAVHEWWLENVRGEDQNQSPEIDEAKREYWTWKAKKEKISVQKLRDELMDKKEIATQWSLRVGEITAALNTLKDRLTPTLVGKPREEIAEIIEEEVRLLRSTFARRDKYCRTEDV